MYQSTKEDVATGVRLPQDLHKRIHQLAWKEHRTFNSMLVMVLKAGLEKPRIEEVFDAVQEIKQFVIKEAVKPG